MNENKINFGTNGWRAIVADDFTYRNIERLILAISKHLILTKKEDLPIAIGFDTRFISKDAALFAAELLSNNGFTVELSRDFIPTPVLGFYLSKRKKKYSCGLQFTASHNPAEYGGLKLIMENGAPAPEEVLLEITKLIDSSPLTTQREKKELILFDSKKEYFEYLKTFINIEKIKSSKIKVAYDPMHASGIGYLDELLTELGCNVETINNNLDPLFKGKMPDPKEEYLLDLCGLVKSKNIDLGIATDGDADRISIVNNKGEYFSPNKIAPVLVKHLIKNKGQTGLVVRTMTATHLIDEISKTYNAKVLETKVGFKWISKAILKEDVLLAAEESGGFTVKGHIPDKDGILTACILIEMLAYENKGIEEIYKATISKAGKPFFNKRYDLKIFGSSQKKLLSLINKDYLKEVVNIEIDSINTSEGVKCVFSDGSWIYVRPSGTEPMTRIYLESSSKETLKKLEKVIDGLIKEIHEDALSSEDC